MIELNSQNLFLFFIQKFIFLTHIKRLFQIIYIYIYTHKIKNILSKMTGFTEKLMNGSDIRFI